MVRFTLTCWPTDGQFRCQNPSRQGDGLNYRTSSIYDTLNRIQQVLTLADGATTTASYSGNTQTVTDPAARKRKISYDGLGRLAVVAEDPDGLNYTTGYYYDALNNLTLVNQGGCPACENRNTVSISVAILVTCALLAGYLPALRASRIEPMTARRNE
jgi:YD repeat-containing protein